jgi:hypothetical protein
LFRKVRHAAVHTIGDADDALFLSMIAVDIDTDPIGGINGRPAVRDRQSGSRRSSFSTTRCAT